MADLVATVFLRDVEHGGDPGQPGQVARALAGFIEQATVSGDVAIYDFRLSAKTYLERVGGNEPNVGWREFIGSAVTRGTACRRHWSVGDRAEVLDVRLDCLEPGWLNRVEIHSPDRLHAHQAYLPEHP